MFAAIHIRLKHIIVHLGRRNSCSPKVPQSFKNSLPLNQVDPKNQLRRKCQDNCKDTGEREQSQLRNPTQSVLTIYLLGPGQLQAHQPRHSLACLFALEDRPVTARAGPRWWGHVMRLAGSATNERLVYRREVIGADYERMELFLHCEVEPARDIEDEYIEASKIFT